MKTAALVAAILLLAGVVAAQDQGAAAGRLYEEGRRLQYQQGTREAAGQAARKYEEALALWESAGDLEGQARALGSLSGVYSSLGEHRRAVDYLNSRRLVLGRIRDRHRAAGELERAEAVSRQEPPVLEQVGLLSYVYLRDKTRALEALDSARQQYQQLKDRNGVARTLSLLGQVYVNLGADETERRKAVGYLTKVLAMHRTARNRYDEGDALSHLMLAWKALGRPGLAVFYGKQAINLYQSLRAGMTDLERETQETFRDSKAESYRTLADLLIAAGRLAEAEQVLSLLKEEEYFQFIKRAETGPANKSSLKPEEAKLYADYEKIADRLTALGRERGRLLENPSPTTADLDRIGAIDKQLDIANQVFEKFLDGLTRELADTPQAGRVETLREAEAMKTALGELGDGAVALYTLVGAEKYRVILVTPDVRKAHEYTIKRAELAAKVFAFKQALQDSMQDPLPLAQELYAILVGPLAKDLEGAEARTLMWSLDGVLRYIPMAALHDGKRYLVEGYRNEVFTPASLLNLKDQPKQIRKGLGLGVSKAHGDFRALPAVPVELRGIFREEGAGDAAPGVLPGMILLDEAFTADSLKASVRGHQVIHIASHFAINPGDDTASYLLLGDGQHMNLTRMKSILDLGGVELLTLSACNTATTGSPRADGVEVDGLAYTAQRKGAKAVIASLWQVGDESTKLLMQEFYRKRQAGLSKAEALQQAQLFLLNGAKSQSMLGDRGISLKSVAEPKTKNSGQTMSSLQDDYTHPFFWAPFILVGNWK